MLGRDALQQPVGVLRPDLVGRLDQGAGVCAPSSGAWELSSVFYVWEVGTGLHGIVAVLAHAPSSGVGLVMCP